MIRVPTANSTTQEFLGDVRELVFDATELGRRAKAALTEIAEDLRQRQVAKLSRVDPAAVVLTDEQWTQLTRKVKVLSGGPADQW